jgi:Plant specific eukaryotic initiation factor 4B
LNGLLPGKLKPRSSSINGGPSSGPAVIDPIAVSERKGHSVNPFGAAVPREEILLQRGIPVAAMDDKFERKAAVRHYTVEQDAELERVRRELEKIVEDLRNANEQELPEEAFRQAEQAKRRELNSLLEQFAMVNDAADKDRALSAGGRLDGKSFSHNGGRLHHAKDYHHSANPFHDEGLPRSHRDYHGNRRNEGAPWSKKSGEHNHFPKGEGSMDADAYASFSSNRRRQPHEE